MVYACGGRAGGAAWVRRTRAGAAAPAAVMWLVIRGVCVCVRARACLCVLQYLLSLWLRVKARLKEAMAGKGIDAIGAAAPPNPPPLSLKYKLTQTNPWSQHHLRHPGCVCVCLSNRATTTWPLLAIPTTTCPQ